MRLRASLSFSLSILTPGFQKIGGASNKNDNIGLPEDFSENKLRIRGSKASY